MEWLKGLNGQVVGIDTSPFIYFVEENPQYFNSVEPFFEAVHNQRFTVVTSVITLLEVMVYPHRRGDVPLAEQYRRILLRTTGLTCLPVSPAIAERAAQLRAQHNLRTPDAIQLATAIEQGASAFFTNDTGFPAIPGLTILVIDRL